MSQPLSWNLYCQYLAGFLGIESVALSRNTHLFKELCIDSLGIFSLGMHLIEIFGVKIPLSEVASIATVGDLYDAMDRYREGKA